MIFGFLESTTTWLFFSFCIFLFVLWRMGRPLFLGMLDRRIADIKKELAESENLRVEAQELLAQYQRKHRNALKESEEIVAQAQKRADEMRIKADQDLADVIKRREEQLEARLKRIEQAAFDEIRTYAADLAIKATTEIINEQMDKKTGNALIQDAIETLPDTLRQEYAE